VAVADPKQIQKWIKIAESALSLAKAYQSTGLKSEAEHELRQARKALEQILAVDKENPHAAKLLKELKSK